jgi:hypothetical protein
VDYLLVLSIRYPTIAKLLKVLLGKCEITADCPAGVQLPKIVKRDGKWATETDASAINFGEEKPRCE